MPSELETAIEEYAKREAERFFHTTNPQFLPNSITETRRRDYASGILHLAEQLQREDVIEATAKGMCGPTLVGGTVVGDMIWRDPKAREYFTALARAALAAMLAKVSSDAV